MFQEILGTNPWPMTISSSEKFGLYYTSEIISVGNGEEIALMGDLSKWVPMSREASNYQVVANFL